MVEDWVEILDDEQIGKIKKTTTKYAICLPLFAFSLAAVGLYFGETTLSLIFMLMGVYGLSLLLIYHLHFSGDVVEKIKFIDEGFCIQKNNSNEEVIRWGDIRKMNRRRDSTRGGKIVLINHHAHELNHWLEKLVKEKLGYGGREEIIAVPWLIGVDLYKGWCEYLENDGKIYAIKELENTMNTNFKIFFIGLGVLIVTLLVLLSIVKTDLFILQTSLIDFMVFILFLALALLFIFEGGHGLFRYFNLKKLRDVKKKGPPKLPK